MSHGSVCSFVETRNVPSATKRISLQQSTLVVCTSCVHDGMLFSFFFFVCVIFLHGNEASFVSLFFIMIRFTTGRYRESPDINYCEHYLLSNWLHFTTSNKTWQSDW